LLVGRKGRGRASESYGQRGTTGAKKGGGKGQFYYVSRKRGGDRYHSQDQGGGKQGGDSAGGKRKEGARALERGRAIGFIARKKEEGFTMTFYRTKEGRKGFKGGDQERKKEGLLYGRKE